MAGEICKWFFEVLPCKSAYPFDEDHFLCDFVRAPRGDSQSIWMTCRRCSARLTIDRGVCGCTSVASTHLSHLNRIFMCRTVRVGLGWWMTNVERWSSLRWIDNDDEQAITFQCITRFGTSVQFHGWQYSHPAHIEKHWVSFWTLKSSVEMQLYGFLVLLLPLSWKAWNLITSFWFLISLNLINEKVYRFFFIIVIVDFAAKRRSRVLVDWYSISFGLSNRSKKTFWCWSNWLNLAL